jgi:hypothetical protein
MAIGTDSAIHFFGTQDTLGGTATAAVADNNFSTINATTGMNSWTNDDDAPMASVTLLADFSVAPDANSVINLYARPLDVQSTNDNPVPDANFQRLYLGSFGLNDVTTPAQYVTMDIALPNGKTSQEYEFYLENKSGQSLPAGWDFYITPKTLGPHA